MSNLTTYCKDCKHNHTIECNDERKNSWTCPSYKKKMSPHEAHIMRIAENAISCFVTYEWYSEKCCNYKNDCDRCRYDWMMSLKVKEDEND